MPVSGALTIATLLAVIVWLSALIESPSFVARITVENPTDYDVGIDVTASDGGGVLGVGTAPRGEVSQFQDVIDQGEEWVFRFSAQGEDGGELRVTREALERDRWRVRIPAAVGEALRAKGALPSA